MKTAKILSLTAGCLFMAFCMTAAGTVSKTAPLSADTIIEKVSWTVFCRGVNKAYEGQLKIMKGTRHYDFTFLVHRRVPEEGVQHYYVQFREPKFLQKVMYVLSRDNNNLSNSEWYVSGGPTPQDHVDFIRSSGWEKLPIIFDGVPCLKRDYTAHQIIDEDPSYVIIKSRPLDASDTEVDSVYSWIRKADFMPVKFEYYDKDNLLLSLIEVWDTENIDGMPTVIRSAQKDIQNGSESILQVKNIRYDNNTSVLAGL